MAAQTFSETPLSTLITRTDDDISGMAARAVGCYGKRATCPLVPISYVLFLHALLFHALALHSHHSQCLSQL